MLRAQAFEGLFTLVPILLVAVVSIFLRARAARRRKQSEEAARGAPAQTAGTGRAPQTAPAQAAEGTRSAAPFTPQQPGRPQVTTGESHAYPLPLSLNDLKSPAAAEVQPRGMQVPRPVVKPSPESRMAVDRMAVHRGQQLPVPRTAVPRQPQDLRERMLARGKSVQPAAKAAAGERSSITARLEKLPPLKRAVIWAEILGPPGGRQ